MVSFFFIRYWGTLRFFVYEKRINFSKPEKISNIRYNFNFTTKFNDSILITIISWAYVNLSVANEYVGDVTIPAQVITYNQCCSGQISQSD